MKTPCKDCKDRHAECHATCEKYKRFVEKRDEVYEKRKNYWNLEGFFCKRRSEDYVKSRKR